MYFSLFMWLLNSDKHKKNLKTRRANEKRLHYTNTGALLSERGLAERGMKQKAKAKNSHRDDVMNLLLVAVVEESRGFYLFLRRYFVSSFSRIMSVKRRENSHLTFKIFFQPSQSGRRLFCLHLLSDLPCGREFVFYFFSLKNRKSNYKVSLSLHLSPLPHLEESKFKNFPNTFSGRKADDSCLIKMLAGCRKKL